MTKNIVSFLASLAVSTSLFSQKEFTCDNKTFDVKGYEFLTIDYPEGSPQVTHYYIKKDKDKIYLKSFLIENNTLNRWFSYEIDKSFFSGLDKIAYLTTFPTTYDSEDEVLTYTILVDTDYSEKLLYSQYWCGQENTLIENQNWATLEVTFSNKNAIDSFLNAFAR